MIHDIVTVGTGPAGLSVALEAGRHEMDNIFLERDSVGGELINIPRISGFPGISEDISGPDLRQRIVNQLQDYDVEVVLTDAEAIHGKGPFTVKTPDGEYLGSTVILAGGLSPGTLGLPNEEKYAGRGIIHCAECDAPLYEDDNVVVVGGSERAMEDALHFAKFASEVKVLLEGGSFSGPRDLEQSIRDTENISTIESVNVEEISNCDEMIGSVTIQTSEGKTQSVDCDGLLIHVGREPRTTPFADYIEVDQEGYIKVDARLETNIPGIFAAGSVRQHSSQKLAGAIGDGITAFHSARDYLENRTG